MKISTIFFSCLVLALSAFAQGRIIISHPEFKLPDKGVKLQNVDARVDLKNGVANVTLEQEFRNQSSFNLEGEYLLSLQPGAQVYDFHLYIDGKKTQGQILDAAEARKVYNDIVRRMQDPALMEKFHLIINLQAEDLIANIYSPTHDISVDRKGDRNATISVEQTNMAGDKNFVLYYSLGNQEINGTLLTFRPRTDQDGYFLLLASPQVGELDQPPIPQDVIFVIDVSGSMQGEKLEQAKGALKFCVNALSEKDRFDIVNFSSSIQNFQEKLDYAGKERKENATYFIEKMRASGGTNLNEALLRGLQLAEANKEGMTTLILLTDGLPTEGQTDVNRILGNIRQENKNEIRIFCFGLGYDVNTFLLDKMSKENHGSVTYIKPGENLEKSISGFFAKITEPVLTNPQIKFDTSNLYDIYPQTLPDIFKDDRIAVFGRYRNPGDLKITLQGNQAGHPKKFSYSFKLEKRNRENEFISKLWANRKVDHLLDQIRFNGE
ncbi:MAG: VWA domain-containing protein, partial [Calditrichia bacterium]